MKSPPLAVRGVWGEGRTAPHLGLSLLVKSLVEGPYQILVQGEERRRTKVWGPDLWSLVAHVDIGQSMSLRNWSLPNIPWVSSGQLVWLLVKSSPPWQVMSRWGHLWACEIDRGLISHDLKGNLVFSSMKRHIELWLWMMFVPSNVKS